MAHTGRHNPENQKAEEGSGVHRKEENQGPTLSSAEKTLKGKIVGLFTKQKICWFLCQEIYGWITTNGILNSIIQFDD